MSHNGSRNPRVMAIDAGGTMTDTFIVDESDEFVVGKAQTTPQDNANQPMRIVLIQRLSRPGRACSSARRLPPPMPKH